MPSVDDAIDFLREANDAESENRQLGLQALQFRYGDQWPQYAVASRGLERPQLTINETNTYIKKVCNAQRQQKPRVKASPINNEADDKIAKVITGLFRHIENISDADYAYDTAFDFAATIGWGYFRMRTDYIAPDSFDQEIYIEAVNNPFCVYFDPNSKLPDGSDSDRALITDIMAKTAFEKMYPGATTNGFADRGTGDSSPDWVTDQDIRLAEFYYAERVRHKLVALSDGSAIWEDQLPPAQVIQQAGILVTGTRESMRRTIKWCKQTGYEILEEKTLPGRWIPVIPVKWTDVMIDSRRVWQGMVKDMMDPARMNNFWQTAITETLAMAPKAKWLVPEGADEGHERDFATANTSPTAVLRYKTTGVDGKDLPPPERIQPDPPPAGMIEATFMAQQNLSRAAGVFDPAVRGGAQHKSDKTLNAERSQAENSNYDGYDNLTRSIKHCGRIALSWVPSTYDTQRVQRIIGEDGREEMVVLNEKVQKPNKDTGAIEEVIQNNLQVGLYDVVMETGPGYDTKRQEGVAAMIDLMATPLGEKVAQSADDLIVRSMDFPGSDLVADRLAAANPLSQIDEKSDIPPQAQMLIKNLQTQLQQATQAIGQLQQEIKLRGGIEKIKQDGATQRTLMQTTTQAHDSQLRSATYQHDVESRAVTAQNVEEIKAITQLLLKHIDTAQLEREIEARNQEQAAKASEATPALQ